MINGGTKMVAFDDSGYTRRDLIRGFLGLGAAAVTGGLANALNGCASDPIADSRFGEYSAKTLVSTTVKDRKSEQDFIRDLRTRNRLADGEDGLSFVVYKLDVEKEKGKVVVSREKAAEILEASILRGEDLSGRTFRSYSNLPKALESLTRVEKFIDVTTYWTTGTPTTGTATPVKELQVKREKEDTSVSYNNRSPIAVVNLQKGMVVGLYVVDPDLRKFAEDPKLTVDDLNQFNLLNKDLYEHNAALVKEMRNLLKGVPCATDEKVQETLEKTGGTLAYLLDSELKGEDLSELSRLFNKDEINAMKLGEKMELRKVTWKRFSEEDFEPVFPDEHFGRSYALELGVDKKGKVFTKVISKGKGAKKRIS